MVKYYLNSNSNALSFVHEITFVACLLCYQPYAFLERWLNMHVHQSQIRYNPIKVVNQMQAKFNTKVMTEERAWVLTP